MSGNTIHNPAIPFWYVDAPKSTRSDAEIFGPWLAALVVTVWCAGLVIGFQAALTVLTAIGFILAGVGLIRPFLGIAGVGMLCTLDATARVYVMTGGIFRWNTFNYWLLVVLICGLPMLWRRTDIHFRIFQAFILLLLLELTWTPDFVLGGLHILNVMSLFGLLVYFERVATDDRAWCWLAMICGAAGAAGGLVYFLQRSSLKYIDPNAFAYLPLTAMFTICLGFHLAKGRQLRFLLGMLATANFCWVFLTGSRGSLLVAILCIGVVTISMRGIGQRAVAIAVGALIAIVVFTQFRAHADRTVGRVNRLVDSRYSSSSRTSGRFDLMVGGWHIFLKNPLGVGTGGYAHHWANLEPDEVPSNFARGRSFPSHCGWIKILAENGIPGAVLFISFVLSFAIVGWTKRRQGLLLNGLLASGVLALAFVATEFQGKGLWFLAAGTITLLHRHVVDHEQRHGARTEMDHCNWHVV